MKTEKEIRERLSELYKLDIGRNTNFSKIQIPYGALIDLLEWVIA